MVGSSIASRIREAREAEVVEEACCIAYSVCNATAPPGQHENSTEVDTAGVQRQGRHTH